MKRARVICIDSGRRIPVDILNHTWECLEVAIHDTATTLQMWRRGQVYFGEIAGLEFMARVRS